MRAFEEGGDAHCIHVKLCVSMGFCKHGHFRSLSTIILDGLLFFRGDCALDAEELRRNGCAALKRRLASLISIGLIVSVETNRFPTALFSTFKCLEVSYIQSTKKHLVNAKGLKK